MQGLEFSDFESKIDENQLKISAKTKFQNEFGVVSQTFEINHYKSKNKIHQFLFPKELKIEGFSSRSKEEITQEDRKRGYFLLFVELQKWKK